MTLRTQAFFCLAGILFVCAAAQAQIGPINDSDRVVLPSSVPAQLQTATDQGMAPADLPMERMVLVLSPRPGLAGQRDAFIRDLNDPASPLYHQWLTPEQYGARFGISDGDLNAITGWLVGHGFTIDEVGKGRGWINFSGTVTQVETAFQTQIRQYSVNGELHHANATPVTIPHALSSVVAGPLSLHDFLKKPNHLAPQVVDPNFTSGGSHYLAPADFALIYDVNPLYAAGTDGTGQTIAIVGRTDILLSDVTTFRNYFGLPANNPVFIHNGPDPGDLGGGEETEADLDVQWSGAVARNASFDFVISKSTATTDGVDLSAQYIVNNNLAPVMSTSFGSCEQQMGPSENAFYNNLWAQAATQGITSFVSSGDSGAAGCDPGSAITGTVRAVNGLASTPYNVAVGGTKFLDNSNPSLYWASSNDPVTKASALSYIPEEAWNESGFVGGSGLWATGGGASTLYAKPSWQVARGVPADGVRDVPDVSLSSASHDGYLIFQGAGLYSVGGTSAASPSFAGLMALVNQKTASRQGNANTVFYPLANNQYNSCAPIAFHDITVLNNTVPGVTGFNAVTGYDQATGLGSVDAKVLVNNWSGANLSICASPTALTVAQGASGTSTISATAQNGFNSSVSLSATGLPGGVTASFSVNPIPAPGTGSSVMTLNVASTTVPGTYPITVTGTGGSVSQSITVTLTVPNGAVARLSTTSLGFGNQVINTSSTTRSVTLTNAGQSPLTVSSISASAQYAETDNCTAPLNPNASCTIQVTFTPTQTGSVFGSITISDNATPSPQIVNLTGTGVLPLTLTPSSITFPTTASGEVSAPVSVRIANSSTTSAISLTGFPISSDFVIQSNTCGSSLAAGAFCNITVSFAPNSATSFRGSLTITDSSSPNAQVVNLYGTGAAAISFSPTSLTFANQVINTTSAVQNVIVTNRSASAVTINSISTTGDYSQTNTCGSSLASAATCVISVSFTPTMTGTVRGSLVISDSAAGSPQQFNLTGTGVQPVLVNPSALYFPNTAVGSTSAVMNVTVTNYTGALLPITSIAVSAGFNQTNTCGASLGIGSSCVISVTFTPTTPISYKGSVVINDSASTSPQQVSLSGTGTGGTASTLTFSPTGFYFPNVLVGNSSSPINVRMTNTGAVAVNISGISIGAGSSSFSQTNNCPAQLAPAAFCTITATFSPKAAGALYGAVVIGDDSVGNPHVIPLSGTGLLPVSLSTSSLSFASTPVGATTAAQNVTLKNNTAGNVTLNSIAPSPGFTATNNCPATLAPNGSCVISVSFAPAIAGSTYGSVTISDSDPSSPQVISLYGNGLLPLTMTPTTIGFPNTAIGVTSAAQNVTLTNNTSAAIAINSVTPSTGFLQSNTCGTSLGAHLSCVISIQFSPTYAGSIYGSVVISDSAVGSPQIVSVYGTGVAPVTLSPTSLNFGTQTTGTTSAPRTATLTNTSGATLNISSIQISADYAQTNNCPASMAPGASCTLSVTFTPNARTSIDGSLWIVDNASTSPQVLSLIGTGS